MSSDSTPPAGPDLEAGVPFDSLADGVPFAGHVGDDAVILVRRGDTVHAIGATCTHYGGPLAEGLVEGDTVRCPWHHACFSLRTGEALWAPALDPVPCFAVSRNGNTVRVGERVSPPSLYAGTNSGAPERVILVGVGAAGTAAAEMLRRSGYTGEIRAFDARRTAPVDRPNLSKDYLAGNAPEEWLALRPDDFWSEHDIHFDRGVTVRRIDVERHEVETDDGARHAFDRLLIATGATPVKLQIPGADGGRMHYLRSLDDCRGIIAAATSGAHAVVLGASFIGLEVAASLRAREVTVDVVAPDQVPFARTLGPELGARIQREHESHGVRFHLGHTAKSIGDDGVTLDDGTVLPADFVVAGIGVRPDTTLAAEAGLQLERGGVVVNEYLETSVPGIFAAGDIAAWPDPRAGRIRVEHWVVAERQGQVAARNMLGRRERYTQVPFFWTHQFDVDVRYVGHAGPDDQHTVDGDLAKDDASVRWTNADGRLSAEADVGRDRADLEAARTLAHEAPDTAERAAARPAGIA